MCVRARASLKSSWGLKFWLFDIVVKEGIRGRRFVALFGRVSGSLSSLVATTCSFFCVSLSTRLSGLFLGLFRGI